MRQAKADLIQKILEKDQLNNTGYATSSFIETYKEFINRWFNSEDDLYEMTGRFDNNAKYIWSIAMLEGVADMIVKFKGGRVIYFFKIED